MREKNKPSKNTKKQPPEQLQQNKTTYTPTSTAPRQAQVTLFLPSKENLVVFPKSQQTCPQKGAKVKLLKRKWKLT
jgi:hypothetical protein